MTKMQNKKNKKYYVRKRIRIFTMELFYEKGNGFYWLFLQKIYIVDIRLGSIYASYVLIPQNGQTHSNNLSAVADELFECFWPFCGADT